MKRLQQWQRAWQSLQQESSDAPSARQADGLPEKQHLQVADDELERPNRHPSRTPEATGSEDFASSSRRPQERDESRAWQPDALQHMPSPDSRACAQAPLPRGDLEALIERHCARVLIQSGAPTPGHAPHVMLDLGRWMPGCSVELARGAGQLRLTLRGVAVQRVQELGSAFEELGEALAQRLGCAVVTAVDSQGERR